MKGNIDLHYHLFLYWCLCDCKNIIFIFMSLSIKFQNNLFISIEGRYNVLGIQAYMPYMVKSCFFPINSAQTTSRCLASLILRIPFLDTLLESTINKNIGAAIIKSERQSYFMFNLNKNGPKTDNIFLISQIRSWRLLWLTLKSVRWIE